MSVVVVIVFVVWFGLTVLNQLHRPSSADQGYEMRFPRWLRTVVATANASYLLPRYRFFAPEPVDADFHITYRDLHADGSRSSWQEVDFPRPTEAGALRMLWNPFVRDHGTMLQCIREICILGDTVVPVSPMGLRIISVSFPYLFLLHQVMRLKSDPQVEGRQLLIVETTGSGGARRLSLGISSEVHRVDPAGTWSR
jgi:hypothetical protein